MERYSYDKNYLKKKTSIICEIVEFSQKRGRRTIARTSDTSLRLSVQFRSCG